MRHYHIYFKTDQYEREVTTLDKETALIVQSAIIKAVKCLGVVSLERCQAVTSCPLEVEDACKFNQPQGR